MSGAKLLRAESGIRTSLCSLLMIIGAVTITAAQPAFEGFLVAKEKPVVGGRVLLGRRDGNTSSCSIDVRLTATTDQRGRFVISADSPGEYCVLFNYSGSLNPRLDGLRIDFSPETTVSRPRGVIDGLLTSLRGEVQPVGEGLRVDIDRGKPVLSGFIEAPRLDVFLELDKTGLPAVTVTGSGRPAAAQFLVPEDPLPARLRAQAVATRVTVTEFGAARVPETDLPLTGAIVTAEFPSGMALTIDTNSAVAHADKGGTFRLFSFAVLPGSSGRLNGHVPKGSKFTLCPTIPTKTPAIEEALQVGAERFACSPEHPLMIINSYQDGKMELTPDGNVTLNMVLLFLSDGEAIDRIFAFGKTLNIRTH